MEELDVKKRGRVLVWHDFRTPRLNKVCIPCVSLLATTAGEAPLWNQRILYPAGKVMSTWSISHHTSYTRFLSLVITLAFSLGKSISLPTWSWPEEPFFPPSKLLEVKEKQSSRSVCRHGLRKPPFSSRRLCTHKCHMGDSKHVSHFLHAASCWGLHKKNPWTSDYFLKHLLAQIFQQTDMGAVPVRPVECCLLVCPATFPTISALHLPPHQHLPTQPAQHTYHLIMKPSAYTAAVQV